MSPCALRRVVRYIDEHLTEEIRLEGLARVAGLSHHRFAHNFKRTTGLPPHQYVIRRRVECAKPLLRDTDNTVANLTYALGFGSPSRFASPVPARNRNDTDALSRAVSLSVSPRVQRAAKLMARMG